jgi:hypothetical protein
MKPRPIAPPNRIMQEVRRLEAEAAKKQRAEDRKAAKAEPAKKARKS